MKKRPSFPVAGFTLVEVLVVVGILAILVALATPGIRKMKEASQDITCVNNLRQFGSGIFLYAGEHNGDIYPSCPQATWYWLGDEPWGAFTAYEGVDFAPYVGYAYGMPQLSGNRKGLLYCPAISKQFPGGIKTVTLPDGCLGYGMNHWMYATKPSLGRPTKLSDFSKNPARKLVLADSAVGDIGVEPFNGKAFPESAFRHRGRINALFLDGHVNALVPGEVEDSEKLRELLYPDEN